MIHPVRNGIGVTLALMLTAAAATGFLYHSAAAGLRDEVHGSLLRLAHAATSLVDGDLHRTLVSPEQYGSESYDRILLPLRGFLRAMPDAKYLYTAVLRGNEVCFGVDSALPVDADGDGVIDQAGLLQVYEEAPPCMLTALREGRAVTTAEPYTDKWGTFITGCVPFYDSAGAQVGVVCLDITAEHYEARLAALRNAAVTGAAPAILLSLLIGGGICWLRRSAARARLRELASEEALQRALRRGQRQQAAVADLAVSPAVVAGDVGEVARAVVAFAANANGVERVGVWLFDDDGAELRCIDLYEASAARHSFGSILRRSEYEREFAALENARYIDAHDPLTDPRTAGLAESYFKPLRITSVLSAAIRVQGRTAGALCLEHIDRPHEWEQDEIAFACQLGEQVAITILNHGRQQTEAALRASEKRFMDVLYASGDAILLFGGEGFVDCNDATARMLGYSNREAILMTHPAELSPPTQPDGSNSFEKANALMRRAFEDGFLRFEWVHRRANGEDFPAEVSLTPVVIQGRNVLHCVWRDITEHKQAEEKLRSRMAEIERFNRMAVRRELRIAELKQKINELVQMLGHHAPYRPARVDAEIASPPATEGPMAEAVRPAAHAPLASSDDQELELAELVDLAQMQRLLDSFCAVVGVAAALIDLQGRVLIGSRWRRICTEFHRVHPQTLQRCIESDTRLANRLQAGESCSVYQCCNGLTDAASPVTIQGRHVANAFVGQFLLAPADEDAFRRQAAEFGFDPAAYLQALSEVPIVPPERLPFILDFLVNFAQLAATMGLERLQARQAEAHLAQRAAELDQQRGAALNLAEDAEEAQLAAETSEEALRRKTAFLEAQVNASLDGILVVDPNQRRLLINQRLIEMWCVPQHVVEDENDTSLLNHVVGLARDPEVFLAKVTYLYSHSTETSRDEVELISGAILDRYSAPVLGEDGRHYGRIWTFRDITERRRAEEALRASETRLQGITDSAQDAILMMDPHGIISYWNPAATSILGYQREEALGQNLHNLLAPERYRTAHLAVFPEFIRTGRGGAVGQTVELVARRKDGQEIAVALSLSAFLLDGAWHAVGILRDITAQKRAEAELLDANRHLEEATARAGEMAVQAEAANRAKSEFLANMSHEIRTPMTAILGFADVLLEQGDLQHAPPERIDAAQTIKSNGEYLLGIINDILDLSKIEAGKMTVECVSCAPCGLVAEVASLMRVRARAKGLALDVEYEHAIPETIQTDPTRLRQILVNVLANAIKFTETGRVQLITRFTHAGGQPRLEFDVTDTGVGLTAEQVARLFQPFTQADASTTRQFGGTGLGLAISKRLAQLLSGSITVVETQPGVGTRFRIAVATGPLDGVRMLDDPVAATTVASERQTQPESLSASPLGGCRILLAEDGPDNQRLISHLLTKAGAAVTVVENGKLAVEAALAARDEGPPFDLVLMDMQMPVLDGYTAASLLRRKGYQRPIIALTAHAMAGDREQCLAAGCDDYATKPIDRRKLLETLLRHVHREPAALAN